MKTAAITFSIYLGLAATAAAEGAPHGKPESSARPSKQQLSEIRSVVHELERASGKLADLMAQYRSMLEQRPRAKKGSEQLEKWKGALDRLVRRIGSARTVVFDSIKRLDQLTADKQLPTSLGKDVANARNEADALRAEADHVLAKHKPARVSKDAKKKPPAEDTEPPLGDIDDM